MAHWATTEIVIELANTKKRKRAVGLREEDYGPTNTYFVSKLFGTRLRGRWSIIGMRGMVSSNTEYGMLPDIPGIYYAVDPENRTVRLLDPLSLPENAAILREANRIMQPHTGEEAVPWEGSHIHAPTDTEIKTALWEMHCWLEQDKAVLVNGTMPDRDAILDMKGDLKIRTGEVRRRILSADGKTSREETVYARPDELERLRKPEEQRIRPGSAVTSEP